MSLVRMFHQNVQFHAFCIFLRHTFVEVSQPSTITGCVYTVYIYICMCVCMYVESSPIARVVLLVWNIRVRLVTNPARGKLNRANDYFPVPARNNAWEFGLVRRVRPSRPASACSFSALGLNLIGWCLLTELLPISAAASIHTVPSLSGHAIAYRRRSLRLVSRHRASSPQGSSSNGRCLFRYQHGPTNLHLSFPTPIITVCTILFIV